MTTLIDSHCHLTSDSLFGSVDEVIARGHAAGIAEFVTIATDLVDAGRAIDLSQRHPSVHVAAGIHPHEAGKVTANWDSELASIINRPDVFAVGEMGLDFHYDFSDRPSQLRVFRRQLELAARAEKPIVIHCREAHADVMSELRAMTGLKGVVFHCFTGTSREAAEILEAGYWLSLTGVVTFKKSNELREVARMLPADRIMLETDSPYLSPEPVRSVRPNEPAHLVHTTRRIANERGMSIDELALLSSENTRRFFLLPAS